MSGRLRQSLSKILTIFYPLAGEMKENSFVDCNDGGAEFVEARVRARLDQFIQNPKADELKQFVPRDSLSHKDDVLLSVKVSFFDCGGVAVGVCLSHKIADASSLVAFMNAWVGTCNCRGEGSGTIHPSFDLALRFPPRDISSDQGFDLGITKEKIATERLVFEGKKVENLRKLLSSDEVKDPSKVEVVSASIMESFIGGNKAKSSSPSTSSLSSFVATHAVNLRPRTVPPIADYAFGNCVVPTWAIISSSSLEEYRGGSDCVAKLRAAIRAVDDEYINNIIAKVEDDISQAGELFRAGNIVLFTSWRRFPTYDVDFGWGKPVWVSTVPMPYMNLVVLMDTPPSQDGIEAWVNIVPHHNFLLKN